MSQSQLSPIFKYQSAKRYLVDYVNHQQKEKTGFSLRKWSKSMGLNSHAHLVMILQGKRPLTLKQVPILSQGLNLSSPERLYFQALIQLENAATPEEKELCRLWLNEVNPGEDYRIREVDEYLVIAHWVHMAILAMTDLKGFKGTAEDVAKRLGTKVSVAEARAAIERLLALGLIKVLDQRLVCTASRITTKDDVANRGAREYHKQVAELAVQALENQSVMEREFQSFVLTVPKDKIPLAKEMIKKFRSQFTKAIGVEATALGDEVYQTQIQFFKLTESPVKKLSAKGKKLK